MKIFTLKNPDVEKAYNALKEFTLSERSKALFKQAKGGNSPSEAQGFIGLLDLTTGIIELIPAFNKDDGKERVPFIYEGVNYFVDSTQQLGTQTGDAHIQAVSKLKLGDKGNYHGCIAGFGIFKGSGTKENKANVLYQFRNKSSSQNFHAFEYDELALMLGYNMLEGDEENNLGLAKRCIPAEISEKLLKALIEQLPIDEETQIRGCTNNHAMNIKREKNIQDLCDLKVAVTLTDNMFLAAQHEDYEIIERIYALKDRVAGLSLNSYNNKNQSLLSIIAKKAPLKIIERFLDLDVNIPPKDLAPILTKRMFLAYNAGQKEDLKKIYSLKSKVPKLSLDAKDNSDGKLTHIAVRNRDFETLEWLLQSGATPDDGKGKSLLLLIAEQNHI